MSVPALAREATVIGLRQESREVPIGGSGVLGCMKPRGRLRVCHSVRSTSSAHMTRIEITPAALAASATRGAVEPQRSPEGGYFIWFAPKVLKRLDALRGPSESYSDAILRLAVMESTDQ
jgi:hypothetical protein